MAEPITIECAASCAVEVQLSAAPPSLETIETQYELFLLFLLPLVVVWGWKQLYKLFQTGPQGD